MDSGPDTHSTKRTIEKLSQEDARPPRRGVT
ncbi:hypothetical protein SAMN06296020_101491 [Anoxynatronum buryatiense]|uniref:Uncharacterized protein n=1 Tax=Anoxynatronum buryatiense TaxID=489973 RepID=A0AA45WTD8_9CLOT|nr:hypothetical protein SAMN06296020_101491 [Anoxynatronum buryatiense]